MREQKPDGVTVALNAGLDAALPRAHDALNKLHRAHQRGTGVRLTAGDIAALSVTSIGELWAEPDPRGAPNNN